MQLMKVKITDVRLLSTMNRGNTQEGHYSAYLLTYTQLPACKVAWLLVAAWCEETVSLTVFCVFAWVTPSTKSTKFGDRYLAEGFPTTYAETG